jgi:hypothetical protein
VNVSQRRRRPETRPSTASHEYVRAFGNRLCPEPFTQEQLKMNHERCGSHVGRRHQRQQRLTVKAARQRIDERDLERAIFEAANHAGLSQRQISGIVGIHSQATVQRILRRLTENPALLDETPAEIIDNRAAGLTNTKDMMDRLLNWKYSFGGVVRVDGVATDAYATGDWDEIEMAFYRGAQRRRVPSLGYKPPQEHGQWHASLTYALA